MDELLLAVDVDLSCPAARHLAIINGFFWLIDRVLAF
jgi:hypothetical protein